MRPGSLCGILSGVSGVASLTLVSVDSTRFVDVPDSLIALALTAWAVPSIGWLNYRFLNLAMHYSARHMSLGFDIGRLNGRVAHRGGQHERRP